MSSSRPSPHLCVEAKMVVLRVPQQTGHYQSLLHPNSPRLNCARKGQQTKSQNSFKPRLFRRRTSEDLKTTVKHARRHALACEPTLPFKTRCCALRPPDQRRPAARSSQSALPVLPRMCAVSQTWWEGGEVSPKTSLDIRETMPSSHSPDSPPALWICWFSWFLFFKFFIRTRGRFLSQRMLPRVTRILYILSFCSFQGGLIR